MFQERHFKYLIMFLAPTICLCLNLHYSILFLVNWCFSFSGTCLDGKYFGFVVRRCIEWLHICEFSSPKTDLVWTPLSLGSRFFSVVWRNQLILPHHKQSDRHDIQPSGCELLLCQLTTVNLAVHDTKRWCNI